MKIPPVAALTVVPISAVSFAFRNPLDNGGRFIAQEVL
jgi:hypothetical protein